MHKSDATEIARLLAKCEQVDGIRIRRIRGSSQVRDFHHWADSRWAVAIDRLERNGTVLLLLLIDWWDDGEYYAVVFPEDRKGPLIEIHRLGDVGADRVLRWRYKPTKRDGRNAERRSRFIELAGSTEVALFFPVDVVSLGGFLNDLFDLVSKRRSADTLSTTDDQVEDRFPEGRLVEALHYRRERSATLIAEVKKRALKADGRLRCQVCGFDFEAVYGELGKGFIEGHHTVPLSSVMAPVETRPEDIVLVCANCHRMLHRRRPWISDIKQLRALVRKRRTAYAAPRRLSPTG